MNFRRSAFTLIELLMVVVMISILAALSVPNFLEAQVRSKVARARIDMASLDFALKKYYSDNGHYPPHRAGVREYLAKIEANKIVDTHDDPNDPESMAMDANPDESKHGATIKVTDPGNASVQFEMPVMTAAGYDLSPLTTPIAYVGQVLPRDPFSRSSFLINNVRSYAHSFCYLNYMDNFSTSESLNNRLKPGGVGDTFHFELKSVGPDGDDNFTNQSLSGRTLVYDPTNGTDSEGDIIVHGR